MNRYSKWPCFIGIFLMLAAETLLSDEGNLSDKEMSLEELTNYFGSISVASKTEEKISDAPGVISVVTHDELKRFGGTTLGDVLKRVPSFWGTTFFETERSSIGARGDGVLQASSHILLLINGRPMREVLEGGIKSEIYESFPVSSIERIEVVRGPGSALYGTQAFSAVINVVTKSPENNTVSVSGALGEGLHNNVMADLQYKIGKVGLALAGRYADKGGWETDYNVQGATSLHNYNVSIPDYGPGFYGELSYLDKRFLNFKYMASYCEWNNQFYLPDLQLQLEVPIQVTGSNYITGKAWWKKFFSDFGYSLETFKRYKLNANLTYTRSLFETPVFLGTHRDAYEIFGEVTNFFTPVDNLNITLGGVWGFIIGSERNALIDSLIYNEGHKQNTISGYTQIDYRWDWCKVIGGLQANKVAHFKVDFNPRAGLILYPLEHINIKTLYSTAFRAPMPPRNARSRTVTSSI